MGWSWWRKYHQLQGSARADFLRKSTLWFVFILLAGLVVTGRAHWLVAVIAGTLAALVKLAAWGGRSLPFISAWLKKSGPKTISTASLELTIDFGKQQYYGRILQGPHAESELTSLDEPKLREQIAWAEANDSKAAFFLRLLLRLGQPQHASASELPSGTMSRQQALDILGLSADASVEEITRAHKVLMQKLHPDKGGNHYLASLLNEAKATLLK